MTDFTLRAQAKSASEPGDGIRRNMKPEAARLKNPVLTEAGGQPVTMSREETPLISGKQETE